MITVELNGIPMNLQTSPTLFSPNSLDARTRAMLSCVQFSPGDKILDLGCGYGIVGIYAAKLVGAKNVTMVDIDESAVNIAGENARLNSVHGIRVFRVTASKALMTPGTPSFFQIRHIIQISALPSILLRKALIVLPWRAKWSWSLNATIGTKINLSQFSAA